MNHLAGGSSKSWARLGQVHFSIQAKSDLPWSLEPVQEQVLAHPGETKSMGYCAKNLSGETVAVKARHVDKSEGFLAHLDILQCFFSIQQTLRSVEEVEMPWVFQLASDTPPEASEFYMHYEFFPLEHFPDE